MSEYDGGYTRRQELVCTEAQMATYADVVLHENEKIFVKMNSGVIRMKLGDGVTALGALPYTKVYDGDLEAVAEIILAATDSTLTQQGMLAEASETGRRIRAVEEVATIRASGAPTTATVGTVGQLYMDTASGTVYKCVGVSGSTYTWIDIIPPTDETLTQPGRAADAKATGENFNRLGGDINSLYEKNMKFKLVQGRIYEDETGIISSTTRVCTLHNEYRTEVARITMQDNIYGQICFYEDSNSIEIVEQTPWIQNQMIIPKNRWYRIMFSKGVNRDENISPEDILVDVYNCDSKTKLLSSRALWELGGLSTIDGSQVWLTQRIRTKNIIYTSTGAYIHGNGHSCIVYEYGADNSFIGVIGKKRFTEERYIPSNTYFKIAFTTENNVDATESVINRIISDVEAYNLENSNLIPSLIANPDYNINMGTPYMYLSDNIEDENLDNTTIDDVYAIYDDLCSRYPETIARLTDIGMDESGLPIRLYRVKWQNPWISGDGEESLWNNNLYNSVYDYRKLFINAGTHGNEKASVYGVALSIKEIVESNCEFARYIRANFIIDICPIANPWGYNNTSRNGYGNININRDFLSRTRSETIALYDVIHDGDYHACIDSHNSGGNSNYLGITSTNSLLKTYVQMNMKLGHIVYNDWKQLLQGEIYAQSPYLQCWINSPLGTFHDMLAELGVKGYLIESVGVFSNSIGVLTPNNKKYCKLTKDMLINSIIALGSNF